MYVALLLVSLLLLGIRLRFFGRHRPRPNNPALRTPPDGDYTVPLRIQVDSEGEISKVQRLDPNNTRELPVSVVDLAFRTIGDLGMLETAISHDTRGLPMQLDHERFGRPIPHHENVDVVIAVTGGVSEVRRVVNVTAQAASRYAVMPRRSLEGRSTERYRTQL